MHSLPCTLSSTQQTNKQKTTAKADDGTDKQDWLADLALILALGSNTFLWYSMLQAGAIMEQEKNCEQKWAKKKNEQKGENVTNWRVDKNMCYHKYGV